MIRCQIFARPVRAILILVAMLATGIGSVFAEELPFPPSKDKAARIVDATISDGQSRLSIAPALRDDPSKTIDADDRSHLVALPRGTTSFQLEIEGAAQAEISAPEGLMIMRGQPVLRVLTSGTDDRMSTVTVRHNGTWDAGGDNRLYSAALQASLGATLPTQSTSAGSGSFLVIYAPAFTSNIEPLVQWKTLKGYQVATVSTGVTGASTSGIKDYIQNAYDTWEFPPEYILLVGDVDEIPTYNFHGNPSDQNYVQLDGDDFLLDAMIGRLPVENPTEAQTLINKIINYERHPAMADNDWQTRSLMVAGVYASDTPGYTVDFCGEMLEGIGFPAPTSVSSPPLPSLQGSMIISNTINAGVGMVVYRGWAYGTAGWDPPLFTVDNIPALETNNMTPIVMSFVCLNGDYTSSSACFGEVFVRQGSPDEPGKGAVAFIGNGEHWSHTRYNDAMAISIFEIINNENVTDLGTLLNTGKIRFMDYFPNEISADEFGEESVEFYFHIYNLLGDPSMKIWRQLPQDIAVSHVSNLAAGANNLVVTVTDAGDESPISGSRVGVVQNGVVIGTAITGANGTVNLNLSSVLEGSDISVTVTEAGVAPYEGTITTGTASVFLAVSAMDADDSAGNGDQVINPGETLALTATVQNHGTSNSGSFDLEITAVDGLASIVPGSVGFDDLGGGAQSVASATLGLSIAADASDGDAIGLQLDAGRTGDLHDVSVFSLIVTAPNWEIVSFAAADGATARPGLSTDMLLTLRNSGSIASTEGTAQLTLLTPGASLGTGSATLPACQPGQTVTTTSAFDLSVDAATATNTNLTFDLAVTTGEGYLKNTTCAAVVGPVDVSAPVGPDNYGYFAYDSADYDYPASRPIYVWNEISTALGGPGTQLDFPIENEVVWMIVDLPFTYQYYGQQYTQIRVSDNGWISFDLGNDYDFYNWTIPTLYGVEALVAPFWDNLNPVAPQGDENVNGIDPDGIYTYHDEDLDAFVVEWSRLPHYKPEILGMQTFQLVLLNPSTHSTISGDGEMLFLYRQVNNNDNLRMYATVGIESPDGLDGLQLSYGNINAPGMAPLQPGLAVKVTTEAPVRIPFTVSHLDALSDHGQIVMAWETTDDRPVLGWHVDRITQGQRVRLTEAALPGESRMFTTQINDEDADSRYLLTAMHPYGSTSEAGSTQVETNNLTQLALYPAHPNPTRGSTTIGFALPRETNLRLRVYDVAGRLVRTLIDGQVGAGEGVKIWDGKHNGGAQAAGGVYFYRLETGSETLTRKMILVR